MTTKRPPRQGTNAWLRWMYNGLNKDYFDNKLPKRLPIAWGRCQNSIIARVRWTASVPAGQKIKPKDYKPVILQIDPRLKGNHLQKQVGMSMVHEMCHLALGIGPDCREWGGKFDKLMFRLCRKGAFQRFW